MTIDAPPIQLRRVHAIEQACAVLPPGQEIADRDERPLFHRWEWRFLGQGRLQVLFGIHVGAIPDKPELLQVVMLGDFEIVNPLDLDAVSRFASINAPATLVPYIRAALADLSMRGPYGAFHLPMLNVVQLGERFGIKEAEGWKQASTDPSLLSPAVERLPEAWSVD